MERRIYRAAAEGDVASLLGLLKDDPLILDRCGLWSYSETPLHIAAMLGHEKFVNEILDRKPELAGELDSQKLAPLHLATGKGHLGVVKRLLSVNADMCHARDRYGRNPLHIAAVKGRVDVLKELVQESPNAARKKMEHGETTLHLCVKHHNLEALKLLVETVGDHEFVNLKNEDGDTILHLAAADQQTDTINFLMSCTTVEANSPNISGLTAYDLLAEIPGRHMDIINISCEAGATNAEVYALSSSQIEPMTMRASPPNTNDQHIRFPMRRKGWKKNLHKQYNWLERKKSALMVVASLTATMAFQVGVNPPGGLWQDTTPGDNLTKPHNAGESIMADKYPDLYSMFLAFNTLGFIASLSIILLLVSGLPLRRRIFMWVLMVIMWVAISSIAITYNFSIEACTPLISSMNRIVVVGFNGWVFLMILVFAGQMIRLTLITIRSFRKNVKRRRSSASKAKYQDSPLIRMLKHLNVACGCARVQENMQI